MRSWQNVKVKDTATITNGVDADGHPVLVPNPRAGQAGRTVAQTPDDAKEVEIEFDLPNASGVRNELQKVADLDILG